MDAQEYMVDLLVDTLEKKIKLSEESLNEIKLEFVSIAGNFEIKQAEKALSTLNVSENEMVIQKFILSKAAAGLSEKTLKQYYSDISRALRKINKNYYDVTKTDLTNLFLMMMRTASKTTVNNTRRYLSSFYTWLTVNEYIQRNPILKTNPIKQIKMQKKAFSDEEIELLRMNCKDDRERALVEFLLSTGCRAAETANVKIDDINDNEVTILGKGGKYRTVYLSARAKLYIDQYINTRGFMSFYLFPKKRRSNGEYVKLGSEGVNCIVHEIGERAGVVDTHTHKFRRTCATTALKHGMPIELVCKMLGHSSIETTRIYLDITEDDLKSAHKKYVT